MLEDLHGQVPQFFILLREIILDHFEHITQANLLKLLRASFEILINDMHGEARNLCLSAFYSLDKLRV